MQIYLLHQCTAYGHFMKCPKNTSQLLLILRPQIPESCPTGAVAQDRTDFLLAKVYQASMGLPLLYKPQKSYREGLVAQELRMPSTIPC